MNTFPSSIPVLHPVTLTDWLEKLGEKALLCWLQLHSWKTQSSSDHQPYHFRYSLNQLIKKLKMGKNTFYQRILEPLTRYGLITLKRTHNANRETHLVLFSFPQNCPENSLLPLQPVVTTCEEPQQNVLVSPPPSPEPQEPQHPEEQEPSPDDLQNKLDAFPEELRKPILSYPEAINYIPDILTVYQRLHTHPSYTPRSFLDKLQICLKYAPKKRCFAAYFQKSLLNEWNTKPLSSSPPPSPPSTSYSSDVPKWIQDQLQRQQSGHPPKVMKLHPDEQSEMKDLLRQLGELGYEKVS